MIVTRIAVHRLWVPSKGDYRMATSSHRGLSTLVVLLDTDAGVTGIGEAHQAVSSYSPETVATMQAVIEGVYAPLLLGRSVEAPEALSDELRRARMGNPFARSALDAAMFDAAARARGTSVAALLGGPVRTRIALCGIAGLDEPGAMADKAAALHAQGYNTIKAKIGAGGMALDLARVRAIRRAVGDGVALRLDLNGAYAPSEAMSLLRALAGLGIEHVEQPVAAGQVDALRRLTRLGAVPVLADESVYTPEDAQSLCAMRAVDAVKIKLTKVGGYGAARKIISICEAAGVKVVVGQGMCSSIEAAAELQLACASGAVCPVAEMVGPARLQADLAEPGLDVSRGYADLPAAPGIGVTVCRENLVKYSQHAVLVEARAA